MQPLQTLNHDEALTDEDVVTILCDLPHVQSSMCDCRPTALCSRIKARLEADFTRLHNQLQPGAQLLNQLVQEMRSCETAWDNYALTPVLAVPPENASSLETVGVSEVTEVSETMRPFQPIVSLVGQPTERWGPLFIEDSTPSRTELQAAVVYWLVVYFAVVD